MNEANLRNLSNRELLNAVDRSNPEVKELAERFDHYLKALNTLETIKNARTTD